MDIARSSQPPLMPSQALGASAGVADLPPAGSGNSFHQIWKQTLSAEKVTVKKGDTLVGIVTDQYKKLGLTVDDRQAYRQALSLAKMNGIVNPDRIQPGLGLEVAPLQDTLAARNTLQALSQRAIPATATPLVEASSPDPSSNTLLNQTLARAVSKGYTTPSESELAKQKILRMAEQFGFEPDHFAMLTMMESDGMNPKASNGQCHGIIQFCEGNNRGAASVGMAGRAHQIPGIGLLKQLDLVERYFQDLGLSGKTRKLGLDDLYLTVLTPTARAETRRHVPLPIAGVQAKDLYAQGSRSGGITRDSIVAGLTALAQRHFPQWRNEPPQRLAQGPTALGE